MTDDLVKRLRERKDYKVDGFTPVTTAEPLCAEAADRIEELERKVERLTTAQAEIEAKDQLLEKMGADDDHHDPAR